MPQAACICGPALKTGDLVLMARLVDSAGEYIDQSRFRSIEYSIFEIDPCRPGERRLVAESAGVALDIREVILHSPQTGDLWVVDDEGYNFSHKISIRWNGTFPKPSRHYEARYVIKLTTGEMTVVCFQLRTN